MFFGKETGITDNQLQTIKNHFLEMFTARQQGYQYLDRHVREVEKWAMRIIPKVEMARINIVQASVWLHDIGQLFGDQEEDHAVKSEREARIFLTSININESDLNQICFSVRAHRCKDVLPATLEAKVLAAADSASHLTDINYIVHLSDYSKDFVLAKLERDYRDIGIFPWLRDELTPLYEAWKNLIIVYPLSNFIRPDPQ